MIFHSDATQAVGKVPVGVNKQDIDVMSISAHRCTARKAWARSTCAARIRECRFPPLSMAAVTSGACAREPECPRIVGLAKHACCMEDSQRKAATWRECASVAR